MDEAPAKRPRLDPASASEAAQVTTTTAPANSDGHVQAPLERAVGITEYLTPDLPGWSGVLKQRYTDFLVNEIDEDGNVVYLTTLFPPPRGKKPVEADVKPEANVDKTVEKKEPAGASAAAKEVAPVEEFKISDEDAATLTRLTSPETTEACIAIFKSLSDPTVPKPAITTPVVTSKEQRTEIHNAVRRIFSGKFQTQTVNIVGDEQAEIIITASGDRRGRGVKRGGKKAGQTDWAELGGEYLHFTLYKENRDTMEIIHLLPRIMRIKGPTHKIFSYAGTKDRRAVTVQRCSAYRIKAERLAGLNKVGENSLRNGKLGDFSYHPAGLELGMLKGNEFYITLRGCTPLGDKPLEDIVAAAVSRVRETGFANYFGLQRFGSFTTATSTVGIHLLRSEWKTATEAILSFDAALLSAPAESISSDERRRAEAAQIFLTTGDVSKAANLMPHKFIAESTLLRWLVERNAKNGGGVDYLGAIQAIPRGTRTMYVHAYQSLVFNHALSARLRLSHTSVLVGDLVLVPKATKDAKTAPDAPNVDQHGEEVVTAAVEEGREYDRARALTQADIDSGRYTLADVVLPTPGWDVIYPENEVGAIYTSLMKEHGLNPKEMRRSVKDWSLPGTYRRIISRFVDDECAFEVKRCKKGTQVVQTDLECIIARQWEQRDAKDAVKNKDKFVPLEAAEQSSAAPGEKRKREEDAEMADEAKERGEEETVVVLRMRLGTSCYATMALRELMKGGVTAYKPEFGREIK